MASKTSKKVSDVEMKDESETPEATDEKTETGKKESDLITLEGEASISYFKNTSWKFKMNHEMRTYSKKVFLF